MTDGPPPGVNAANAVNADAELDFDRAQSVKTGATGNVPALQCKACSNAIGDTYYSVAGQLICPSCQARFKAAQGSGGSPGQAVLYGLGAATAGALLYYAIVALTHYELGLVAIVVGVMVGKAVRKGAGARTGFVYRLLALVLTYLAISATYAQQLLREGDVHSFFGALILSWMLPAFMLIHFENMMGLVILGIGLYEAYKLSAPRVLAIEGPFTVQATPATAVVTSASVASTGDITGTP